MELWSHQCFLPPRDQDHDGLGDICDLCEFAWDPENLQYVDATGRLWPMEGAYCNGAYAPDQVCADADGEDTEGGGTGTGGETEATTGDDSGTSGETGG